MSLARVFCSWSIAAVLLLLSITFSSSEKSQTTTTTASVDEVAGEVGNGTTNVTLTGNPQIDYVHDPNLPRELNGYNLSDYPFYHRVPPNINFSCDGRKDGFYASIEHKCQIYHHCLFSNRFDFICANYTAFDQRTFICQFVSDVDCPNSHMYFHRNDALYVTKSTTTIAPVFDREIYNRRRPPKKPKPRPRPEPEDAGAGDAQQQTGDQHSTAAPAGGAGKEKDNAASQGKKNKDAEYSEDDYYEDDYDYPRRARPVRRGYRKCRNGRRRGRRCRRRRPMPYYYDDEDYYDDDYDYAYYDDVRPRKPGAKKRRPLKAIPSETSPQVAESSSETPPPTSTRSTTTTSTERPPSSSSEMSMESGPLDSDAIAILQSKRDELLYKTRRPSPNVRPPAWRPSRQNDKPRFGSTTTTSTERAKPLTTTTTTTTTTEVPQYIYDYEYYEDDTPMMDVPISSTTTTTTTQRPALFRGKTRLSNAAALLEKQRVVQQSSVQVRVTEDTVTNTNTIRRRDNSNVQTPTRVVTHSSTSSIPPPPPPTTPASRPARFWQRKSTVKSSSSSSTKAPTTTTTTLAPYYQDYQDYEDVADPQSSVASLPMTMSPSPQQQSSKFQPLLNPPTHQYGTTPVRQSSYVSNAAAAAAMVLPPQQSVTSSRGHSSYASRPNKHYAMQQQPHQYSQSSSSTSSISSSNSNSNSNNNNYNTNSYHRQRSPQPQSVVPKPEFISLVDEDYNNPYMGGGASVGPVGPSSPPSTRLSGGGAPAGGPGYHHQHPIRFFEQHGPPSFLFGAASEYNNPQLAFPPRNYPSPSNFQPYGHSTRRYSASSIFKK